MAKRKAFPLRIDPRLYEALRKWSDDEFRSVNGQIEYLLRRAVVDAGRWSPSKASAPGSERDDDGSSRRRD